jgi:hypothetical protein
MNPPSPFLCGHVKKKKKNRDFANYKREVVDHEEGGRKI